jgi:hypothetical protein
MWRWLQPVVRMNDMHAAERDESRSARWYATEWDYAACPLTARQQQLQGGRYIPDVKGFIERLAAQKNNSEELPA